MVVDGQGIPAAAQHQQQIAAAEVQCFRVDRRLEACDEAQSHAPADQAQARIGQMQSPLERPVRIFAGQLIQIDGTRVAALEQRILGDPVEWAAA